jgi:CheY-like chemotaxis protein/two-component sensor histidine kinase
MVRLVDDLMEVSRITRGKIDLRRETLNVATILQSAIETSQPLIDEGQHILSVSIPETPLFVDGDAHRLAQVFSNLLNNAAKYSDHASNIWVSAQREDDCAVIAVRDEGMGIDSAMLPYVFDLFAQAEMSRSRAQAGLGIGLALVRRLVEMHDGVAEARSEGRGKGSTFTVSLPLTSTRVRDTPGAAPTDVKFPHRVLVVDDNRDSAQTLAALLEHLGATVSVVYDGASALDAMTELQPSVVFLDIGMPGIDGYEVARRIRRDPRSRHVMLVAVTGWGQQRDRRRAHAAGFNHHLVKPVDLAELQRVLEDFHRSTRGRDAETTDDAPARREGR